MGIQRGAGGLYLRQRILVVIDWTPNYFPELAAALHSEAAHSMMRGQRLREVEGGGGGGGRLRGGGVEGRVRGLCSIGSHRVTDHTHKGAVGQRPTVPERLYNIQMFNPRRAKMVVQIMSTRSSRFRPSAMEEQSIRSPLCTWNNQ